MSTSSGALIATATVAKEDIVAAFRRRRHSVPTPVAPGGEHLTPTQEHDEVSGSRWYILGFGVLTIVLACVISDVIAALTIAYDILVGGLLVAIIGGMVWKRGTLSGAWCPSVPAWWSPWAPWSSSATSTPTSPSTPGWSPA